MITNGFSEPKGFRGFQETRPGQTNFPFNFGDLPQIFGVWDISSATCKDKNAKRIVMGTVNCHQIGICVTILRLWRRNLAFLLLLISRCLKSHFRQPTKRAFELGIVMLLIQKHSLHVTAENWRVKTTDCIQTVLFSVS